jgi:hypothetical protein
MHEALQSTWVGKIKFPVRPDLKERTTSPNMYGEPPPRGGITRAPTSLQRRAAEQIQVNKANLRTFGHSIAISL